MNKKKLILIICLVLLVASVGTAVGLHMHKLRLEAEEAERLRIYHETYLVMDGEEYRRDSEKLDLSGLQLTEVEKLQELTALQELDLRNTGISPQQYDALQAALPACTIFWSVPLGGGYVDNTVQELTLDALSEADLAVFPYLKDVTSVNADLCRDYDELMTLMAAYPEIAVTYTVPLGEQSFPHDTESITIADPDAAELKRALELLPALTSVTLEGELPATEELVALKEAFPNVSILWNFTVCGVKTNSLAEFLDLSKIKMENTEELESMLPCFYNLTKVDMINCGLSNSAMEQLNMRHLKTSFVWKVKVSGVTVRTDIKYFMFYKYGLKRVGDLSNLRYCTAVEVIDFGHYAVTDISFIEYMPNLRFLLMLETRLADITPVGNCTSLEFAELSDIPITDFWCLTNLTNLKGLNLSYTPMLGNGRGLGKFGDITPLLQMTWLERLWLANSRLGAEGQAILREALPNTEMVFYSISSTDRGWRYAPGYFEMRDILGLPYMVA